MGFFDWFSSDTETEAEEESEEEIVRYLCTLEKDYHDMDEFMEDFFDVLEDTIPKYNQLSDVEAEALDRDKVERRGGRWIYEADIKRLDKEGTELEGAKERFYERKSTFKVIAREQPHYAIEISGTKGLIAPFLDEIETVLAEKGMDHEVATIAKPNLGKATQTESE